MWRGLCGSKLSRVHIHAEISTYGLSAIPFMIVNLPADAALTICFSTEALIFALIDYIGKALSVASW
jgi:hypothetical protein